MDRRCGVSTPEIENDNAKGPESRGAKRRRIVRRTLVGIVLVYVLFCLVGPVRWPYTRSRPLSERVAVTEHRVYEICPFFGIAHNNRSLFLPIPMTGDYVSSKDVIAEGKHIASYGPYSDFHLSPDQQYLVVEPNLHDVPIEVLNIADGSKVQVVAPAIFSERHDFDFVYPFGFLGWVDDDKSFRVKVTGAYTNTDRRLVAYRELWRVDARTASASIENRDEKPWSSGQQW
jgi:hypothetical protein